MLSERKIRFVAFNVCADARDYPRSILCLIWLLFILPTIILEATNFTWQVVNSRRIFRGLVLPVMFLFFGALVSFVTLLMLGDIVINALAGRLTRVYFKDGSLAEVGLSED